MRAAHRPARSLSPLRLALAAPVVAALAFLSACAGEPQKPVRILPPPTLVRDVPQSLRGTIGAEATFRGIDPVLVSGLGIVVGLAGTGGSDNLDQAVQATMERDLSRGGIGKGGIGANFPGFEGMTPSEFLRSKDVAVVIVEARIPPGAPDGATFDVYVRTLPGSSVTSLEGGQLWSTDLRIGPAAVFGAIKTRRIAVAKGPIFINPFSGPSVGAAGDLRITRTSGRILAGGKVSDPLQIEMALDNDSFARARSIVSTINSRFPRSSYDDGPTARGRGNAGGTAGYQSIALRVPYIHRDSPEEFLQLVRHMRVDPSVPEEFARLYAEELKSNPALANDLRWCLQSLGKVSLPFLVPMYEYPELTPRLAALEAGASLGDPRAAGPLIDLAKTAVPAIRVGAVRLLGDMPPNPSINLALRDMVNDPNLEIRVAAYEALRKRRDGLIHRVTIGDDPTQPKFGLELIPSTDPMVYITQQGEPRIVVFGGIDTSGRAGAPGSKYRGVRIPKPLLVSAWENRFMLTAEGPNTELRVMYRDQRSGQVTQSKAPEDLAELIEYLAHKPTAENPAPGLGMSYSQTVGALYEISRAGVLPATFATEEDRLRAEIYEAMQTTALTDRPESDIQAASQADAIFRPTAPSPIPTSEAPTTSSDLKSKIVPIKRTAKKP